MKNAVRELTDAELTSKYAELTEELFNLRFRQATNQLENPKRLNTVKKDIARVLTEAKIRGVEVKAKAVKPVKKAKKSKTVKAVKKVEEVKGGEENGKK